MRHFSGVAIPVCLAVLVMLLAGCQPSPKGLDLGGTMYTKRHAEVRAEPRPDAPPVVMVGPNAQVLVLETRDGFSRIGIDNGRIEGWVPSDVLATGPVRETAPRRRRQKAVSPRPRPAAKTPATPAPETPAEAAAPAEAVATPAPTGPAEAPAATPPAPQPATGSGVFSPAEAQAATPPAETPAPRKRAPARKPGTGKQARPDAFDPF